MLYNIIKRIIDLFGAVLGLIILSPIFFLLFFLIKIDSKGHVFFKQYRVGKGGKLFTIYKFRTMVKDAEKIGPQVSKTDDSRITRIGKFLRKYKLDEMPQLINVLRGEMSLVGPRPPISYEVELYKDWHTKRLQVKPGITGLWQVAARSAVGFDDMVMLDLYYIEHWSLLFDFQLLLKTIPAVLYGKGAL